MSKITLNNIGSLTQNPISAQTLINDNFEIIQTAMDNTLSRDGTSPNQLENTLDANDFQIINLPTPATANSPLRLQDLSEFTGSGTVSNIPVGGTTGQVLIKTSNSDYATSWSNSVTSIGLSLPSDFTVSNSPVTTTGTLTATYVSTPTGTGSFVRQTSPSLTTPNLGTPSAATLTNATGLPVSTGISGLATGVATFLATPSSANLAAAITDETGTGKAVFATSPSLTTPSFSSIVNTGTLTLPTSTDTLVGRATTDTLTNKTLTTPTITTGSPTVSAELGFASSSLNWGDGSANHTAVSLDQTQTLTNKTISGSSNTLSNVALSSLATEAANTIVGNFTTSSASPTASTIGGLTVKSSPASTDLIMISDQASSGQLKQATVSSIASAGSVASIAGNTGAFTLSHGITNSTNDIQFDMFCAQGMLFGLTLSTAGSSTTFSINSGFATDTAATDFMKLTSAYSKTTSSWAVGSGNGALDTGTIAATTWYHVFLIKRTDTGVVDILVSTSISAPTMPSPYTLKRRIGSMKTDASSNWAAFLQTGDDFMWLSPPLDVNSATPGTSAVLRTLSVPPGIKVIARMAAEIISAASVANGDTYFSDPDMTDVTPNANIALGIPNNNADNATIYVECRTNTSSQIRTRAMGSGTGTGITINTIGWVDTRGRLF